MSTWTSEVLLFRSGIFKAANAAMTLRTLPLLSVRAALIVGAWVWMPKKTRAAFGWTRTVALPDVFNLPGSFLGDGSGAAAEVGFDPRNKTKLTSSTTPAKPPAMVARF